MTPDPIMMDGVRSKIEELRARIQEVIEPSGYEQPIVQAALISYAVELAVDGGTPSMMAMVKTLYNASNRLLKRTAAQVTSSALKEAMEQDNETHH